MKGKQSIGDARKVEIAVDALIVAIEFIELALGSDAAESVTLKFLRQRLQIIEQGGLK